MKKLFRLFFILFTGVLFAQQTELPKFKSGDVICFIGNSITHDGRYYAFTQAFNATRFPNEKPEYVNCGIAGDVADGMLKRMDEDILSHKPTYAFLMTGMNDIQSSLYSKGEADAETLLNRQKALDNYFLKTEKLASFLIENKAQPIFIAPTIYDQTATIETQNNYGANDALGLCAAHIKKMAIKYNAPLVDFYSLLKAINQREQQKDPNFTIVGKDRVHPQDVGHFVMAYQLIKTVNPSKYISKIEIDVKKGKVIEAINATVQKVNSKNSSFEVLANALPFPINTNIKEALNYVPFQQELNNEIVTIKGLKKGSYSLLIDEVQVGIFDSNELKNGINLAENTKTPQYKQAEKVFDLCFQFHKIQNQLRNIPFVEYKMLGDYKGSESVVDKRAYLDAYLEKQKGKSWYAWNFKTCEQYFETLPKVDSLKEELESVRNAIYTTNKPVKHMYTLIKK